MALLGRNELTDSQNFSLLYVQNKTLKKKQKVKNFHGLDCFEKL